MAVRWERANVRTALSTSRFLEGGRDSDGSVIFVGRALYNGLNLPAKVIPSKRACYVSYAGAEVFVENFEVLLAEANRFSWVPASDGRVADGAVSTGSERNELLYIGRAPFQGSMTVGKIHPSHRCMFLPYNGKEERATNYEVLVYKKTPLHWVPTTSKSPVPHDAVIGGKRPDGAPIYVGRAHHDGDMIPCKVIPSRQIGYVSHNGLEIAKHTFDILVGGDVQWKRERNGKVPHGAYPGGHTRGGEILYIGRVDHDNFTTVGKVHPSHGCLYIPYQGKEMSFKDYEVLVGN